MVTESANREFGDRESFNREHFDRESFNRERFDRESVYRGGFNPQPSHRHSLFGFVDLLAQNLEEGVGFDRLT